MDLYGMTDHLVAERNRLNRIIQLLDRRASQGGPPRQAGKRTHRRKKRQTSCTEERQKIDGCRCQARGLRANAALLGAAPRQLGKHLRHGRRVSQLNPVRLV
jgi:hypothetical protein